MSRDAAEEALLAEGRAARTRSLRGATCRDPALAALLGDAGRAAARRAERLRIWLSAPAATADAGVSPVAPAATEPGASRVASAATERPTSASPGEVLGREASGPGVAVLRIGRPQGFEFRPGQHVRVGLGGVSRPYSLASAPGDPDLEIAIDVVPGGRLSPRLSALSPGERVTLGGVGGALVLDPRATWHVMVATVTGVSPFRAMIRHALGAAARASSLDGAPLAGARFTLLHGASFADELVFAADLTALAGAHPDRLTYLPSVSRPIDLRNASWSGAAGRLGPQLDALLSDTRGGATPRVYACGHPGLVADVRVRAEARGLPVSTESYWKA